LKDGELRLLTLVEELGEYFNSEDGATRSKGGFCYVFKKKSL
jgi:DNA repair/transcription protein MET18/MMS19